jgi:hypothetical protein
LQAGLFGELSDAFAIVVREHLVAENGIGDLRRELQVDFQQSRLQRAL